MSATPNAPAQPDSPQGRAELLIFPTAFPIKVVGDHHESFVSAVIDVVQLHDPSFDAGSLQRRPSSNGTYVGLTVTVLATSREQLDAIYRGLTSLAQVKYVL